MSLAVPSVLEKGGFSLAYVASNSLVNYFNNIQSSCVAAYQQGKWPEAIASFEQSLQISRQLGDVHGEGQTLLNLGLLYKKRHQPDQAKAHWQEALTKLNPSSPDFQKVQQLLTALDQPQRPNFTRWLIPLGIAVFLVACLLKGQWLWALGGVVVVGAMRWGRKLNRDR